MIRALALLIALAAAAPAPAGDLVVTIDGLRSDKGDVRLGLFRKEGWLDDARTVGHAVVKAAVPTRIVMPNVPPGVYGIAVFHDENGNGKHDKNFFGLPLEGYGFSRDAPIMLGPPKFDDAMFEVTEQGAELRFKMRY
jgi:uncharacterized protein (DUF2141 family)